MLPSGSTREVKLKSHSEIKRRKGMFEEVLEAICHGACRRGRRARRLLLVRDGSEAIAKAVRHFWPDAVQQECLVHVERGLCGKLPWKHQGEAGNE